MSLPHVLYVSCYTSAPHLQMSCTVPAVLPHVATSTTQVLGTGQCLPLVKSATFPTASQGVTLLWVLFVKLESL